MGKPKLSRIARFISAYVNTIKGSGSARFALGSALLLFFTLSLSKPLTAQCILDPGQLKGKAFIDKKADGHFNSGDEALEKAVLKVFDENGQMVTEAITDASGEALVEGLEDGKTYRVEWSIPDHFEVGPFTDENGSRVQFVEVPSCSGISAVDAASYCDSENPDIAVSCFVKGGESENEQMETIVTLEYNFESDSPMKKIAMKGETGAIWGLAWKSTTRELFSTSFVKQYASLVDNNTGGIFRTVSTEQGSETTLFADLDALNYSAGQLLTTDHEDCSYGNEVGRIGLGGIALSADEETIYVVNIDRGSVIALPSKSPTFAQMKEYPVADPGCIGGEFKLFALKYHQGSLYVGGTCTAEGSQDQNDLTVHIFELNTENGDTKEIFSTSYPKGYWYDNPADGQLTAHWLTDIEFTRQGNMVISLSDRSAHRYCGNGQILNQFPDILMVWKDKDGNWQLENNGMAGALVGTGQNNGQGPGGGEFFGEDHWIIFPDYHSEVAMGSVYQLPGSDEIVLTAFDPLYNTFAGGLHRYNTTNGSKTGAIELYTTNNDPTFGKASGLGDIVGMCGPAPLEIGNYVWLDLNENGVQDAGEPPVKDLELVLYDGDCQEVGRTRTDNWGQYLFNSANVDVDQDGQTDGLEYYETYYLGVIDSRFDKEYAVLDYENEYYALTTAMNGVGSLAKENDSDAIIDDDPICSELSDYPMIRIKTGATAQVDHSFDIGLQVAKNPPQALVFDLALRYITKKENPVKPGEKVEFDIEIFNQGDIAAGSVCLVDYLPAGLEFIEADNPGWSMDGNMIRFEWTGILEPGENTTVPVILQVAYDAKPDMLVHAAEICGAENTDGLLMLDVDSYADDDPVNDIGGEYKGTTDDVIADPGVIDEDDHDPAGLNILDLALTKSIAATTPIFMGEELLFSIEVANQGNTTPGEIEITDILPTGMELSPNDISGWVQNGDRAVVTVKSPLPPGEKMTILILVRITEEFKIDAAENTAEITSMIDVRGFDWSEFDFDSTPDNRMEDEDDIDHAVLPVFDLALTKRLIEERIYNEGEKAEFEITVFNQGNIPVESFTITDHLPPGIILSLTDPNGWEAINPGTSRLDVQEILLPGESKSYKMLVQVEPGYPAGKLLNIAEISSATPADGWDPVDFDSTPDEDPSNDNGGEIGTNTDDLITDHGDLDEDDHDPAEIEIINAPVPVVDLAIGKQLITRSVRAGEPVDFEITIYNQGEVTVGSIEVTDYFPEQTSLADPSWGLINIPGYGDAAATVLSVENGILGIEGLMPGESVTVNIRLELDADAEEKGYINFAEISKVIDIDGKNIDNRDVDSYPDNDPNNDINGFPGGPLAGSPNEWGSMDREDDFDFDQFAINSIRRTIECQCLNNESLPGNGQFLDELEVYAVSGQNWHIELTEGFYKTTSQDPPAFPDQFDLGPQGDLLTEYPAADGMSFYKLSGIHVDGQGYKVIVRNEYNERLIMQNVVCSYDRTQIEGLGRVCRNGIEEYFIVDPTPGAIYEWSLPDGGSIAGSNQGTQVTVEWDDQDGGPYFLIAEEISPDNCTSPVAKEIYIGQEARAVSCKSMVQISLDQTCTIDVTPDMLLAGGPYDLNSYAIMLTDARGKPIANRTLGREYLDQDIMAKVINACTGNSCWSTIRLEDKMPPEIICLDEELRCNNLSEYAGPLVWDNCDPDPKIILLNEEIETLDCSDAYVKRVTRWYQAEDHAGNKSDICEQTIMLRRIDLAAIEFPGDMSIAEGNPLVCGSFPVDENSNPDPSYTGVPYLEGIPIYPYPDFYCNAAVYYRDTEVPGNGCVRKILREWRAVEWWCSRTPDNKITQVLEITDNVPPEITCPRDMTVTVEGRRCEADVLLPAAETDDNCSLPVTVDVVYPGGFLQDQNGGMVSLPIGVQEIIYQASDGCYNSTECTMYIEVVDETPPVAICDQHTVVGLTLQSEVDVYAATFDDGSYDSCWIDSMAVRRMDGGDRCGLAQYDFGPYATFCCEDVGTTVMVEFRVWDEYQNYNTCMVEVEVQDKIAPQIATLPNDTLDCGDIPSEEDLDQLYGFPVVTDNCTYDLTHTTEYVIDQCREGMIVRTFMARDSNNVAISQQYLYIINSDPFDSTDIIWPLDTTVYTGCNAGDLQPDNLEPGYDYPVIIEDECDLTGFTWEDETYEFVTNNDACFKIVRRWKVINWCRDDENGDPIVYEYDQTIKVFDIGAPEILTSCDSLLTCTYDPECANGFIELVQQAQDVCTPDEFLEWKYEIDAFNDGTIDTTVTGTGAIADASGEYQIGLHSIKWSFEDKCGNKTSCTQIFEIINCKAPLVYCKNGIIVELMPVDIDGDGDLDNEIIEIWAEDLDNGSTHPCGYPLTYSFGRDTTVKNRVYDCDSLGRRIVEICVTTPNGNQACCISEVIVQDNNNVNICNNLDCVIPPPDITVTDCTQHLDPNSLNSFPDTSMCPQSFDITITWRDRGFIPTPPECGRIERTWTIEIDLGTRILTRQFIQIITQELDFMETDIAWPVDLVEIDDCIGNTDPGSLNASPRLLRNFCDLVRITHNDVDISDPNDVCLTLERTWTVTNLCDPGQFYAFVQTIIVYNYENPIVTCPANASVIAVPNACGANVQLGLPFTTDCSTGVTFTNDFNNGGANASGFYPVGSTPVTYTATDRCGQSSTCQIVVEVLDTIPPTIICPDDLTVSCETSYNTLSEFGEPIIVDNCMFTVNADSIFDLDACQIGTILRIWVVEDASMNRDSCSQLITFNNSDPFTLADITWPEDSVTVNNCGLGLHPDTIGSRPLLDTMNATCELVTLIWDDLDISDPDDVCQVIERTWVVENECNPIGTYTFTQIITLLNAAPPILTCPPNVTVNADPDTCGAIVTLAAAFTSECSAGVVITNDHNNGGANASGFFPAGPTVVTFTATDDCGQSTTCMTVVTVIEDVVPQITCPADLTVDCEFVWQTLSDFGEPVAMDNCMFTILADSVIDLNLCQLGEITRTFIAVDGSNNADTCTQVITFENPVPFNEMDHITWPMDTIDIDTCTMSTHPDTIGSRPMIDTISSTCDLVTVSWTDQSTSFCMSSPCLRIERTWVITDSCQFDPTVTPPAGQWTFTQIIDVNDFDPPVISGVGDTTVVTDSMNCDRFVELVATVMDCDPNATITNNSPYAANNNSGDASGEYPFDTTFVTFYAEDACCNVDSLTIMVIVVDTIAPEAMCMKSVKPMNDSLNVPFYPWDMVVALSDNCTDSADITLSFDPVDPFDTLRLINCDSLDMFGEYLSAINIYFTDEAGNQDTCQGFMNVVDPDELCPRMLNGGIVSGRLTTEYGDMLADADVYLDGSGLNPDHTPSNGRYAFPRMPLGRNYVIRPIKDRDPMNGVTTKDLVRIQRHLLGDQPLESPYQIIAADIDRSNSVSVKDIIWLRKMILGYEAKFPNNNTSWRFVDEAYVFQDPEDPFAPGFPEVYDLNSLSSDMVVDFIGVKIGDVTGNARVNGYEITESRTEAETLTLTMEDQFLQAGETTVLRLTGANISAFAGFQGTLSWDPEALSVESVQTIHPSFAKSNIGTQHVEDGRMTISWTSDGNISDNAELMQLVVKARSSGTVRDFISLDEYPLITEAYDLDLLEGEVSLEFGMSSINEYRPALYQNQPNPFSDLTHIVFSLPEDTEVRLTIYDLSGRMIWERKDDFNAGVHAVPVSQRKLNGAGIYIYRLETKEFTASKRMVLSR